MYVARATAAEAVEKARVITEYRQRQREAAANKVRGQAQWGAPPIQLPSHTPAVSNISLAAERGKSKAEDVSIPAYMECVFVEN